MITLADPLRRIRALGHESLPTDRVLIIREKAIASAMKTLHEIVPDSAHYVTVDVDTTSVRKDIFTAINKNTWLIVDIRADLSPDSVTVIKELTRGAVHGEDGVWHNLPDGFRFIAVIDREAMQRQSYPNFLNIFDTAISISY